jgi:LuxR family maltose regulon positive regulatory protein
MTSYATMSRLWLVPVALAQGDPALSAREPEKLGYLQTGLSSADIAAALFISANTLKTHQRAIYRKLGVGDRRAAARAARDQ